MTASQCIKTPSMDVPLLERPGTRESGEKLKRRFTRVRLSQVLRNTQHIHAAYDSYTSSNYRYLLMQNG